MCTNCALIRKPEASSRKWWNDCKCCDKQSPWVTCCYNLSTKEWGALGRNSLLLACMCPVPLEFLEVHFKTLPPEVKSSGCSCLPIPILTLKPLTQHSGSRIVLPRCVPSKFWLYFVCHLIESFAISLREDGLSESGRRLL